LFNRKSIDKIIQTVLLGY